ncbi:type II toxin-antitoxin system PemK/MazF family toxin [Paenibacillus naphthalenovorans]|uniref:PemK-like, MazF-like toxin of type II toxin-antitoxin system n=1 Tax=Paenibacillus naphthalenovorans TaxID=162209 RepID=A0A0U2W3N2_9BACL|nr:type II toxin-antitoxin system PemK/MazF family toxin [Paenibacillus naphthalenovorans]ALS23172.1 PemK-like, MazF-like toxin of type II toxin-antitoxin system [Paenibacillus naphthalenovorans]
MFDFKGLLKIISDKTRAEEISTQLAHTEPKVLSELPKNLKDTEEIIKNVTIEEAIKYILWNGLWNQYGLFGAKKETPRIFKEKDENGQIIEKEYFSKRYSRGKLLSVDLGVSNIGREFCYTHTGIVIDDYPGIVIIIPMTSIKEFEMTRIPLEVRKATIPVLTRDYPQIKEDSYILTNQIRAVSKNRITKVVGSISRTKLMQEIEEMLFERHTPYIKKLKNERIEALEKEVMELKRQLEEKNLLIESLKNPV